MITRRDPGRCYKDVWDQFHSHQCCRRGSIEEDGKRWCRQHLPSAVKARNEAQQRKWKEGYDRDTLLDQTKNDLIATVLDTPWSLPALVVAARKAYKKARGLS